MCIVKDCEDEEDVKCYDFICRVNELAAGAYVVIELRARLWNSTFLEVSAVSVTIHVCEVITVTCRKIASSHAYIQNTLVKRVRRYLG